MSDSEDQSAEDGACAPLHDASLRIDPRSPSSDENELARLMGFGDADPVQDAAPAPRKPPAR